MMLREEIIRIAKRAREASRELANLPTPAKNRAIAAMARSLVANARKIILANEKDAGLARSQGKSRAFIDRLIVNEKKIKSMAECLTQVAGLPDPVGEVISERQRPNGLLIKKIRVPLGVILIIYESRPDVTSDCIGLCLKSGNAAILRGGKEALRTNVAIYDALSSAALKCGMPGGAFSLIERTEHKAVDMLLKMSDYIDLVIPRGGEALIRKIAEISRIPVIKHYKGVCHTFVDESADLNTAMKVCYNAKVQRPATCNAMECMLVHQKVARKFLPGMIEKFKAAGVEIRGCPKTRLIVRDVKRAKESDWGMEYLDLILAVKVVKDLNEAIRHITKYGTQHSDAIIARSRKNAEEFLKRVDSACVYANASTRFTDGNQFGMGAEIGISTDKLHARGPMGLAELCSYKYVVYGKGQVRE